MSRRRVLHISAANLVDVPCHAVAHLTALLCLYLTFGCTVIQRREPSGTISNQNQIKVLRTRQVLESKIAEFSLSTGDVREAVVHLTSRSCVVLLEPTKGDSIGIPTLLKIKEFVMENTGLRESHIQVGERSKEGRAR